MTSSKKWVDFNNLPQVVNSSNIHPANFLPMDKELTPGSLECQDKEEWVDSLECLDSQGCQVNQECQVNQVSQECQDNKTTSSTCLLLKCQIVTFSILI